MQGTPYGSVFTAYMLGILMGPAGVLVVAKYSRRSGWWSVLGMVTAPIAASVSASLGL